MTDNELDNLVSAWISFSHTEMNSPEYEDQFSAWEDVHNLLGEDPESLWRFILKVHRRDPSLDSLLAAGPLEDLLYGCGQDFIRRCEDEVNRDPSFRRVLQGVWPEDMLEDVVERLLTLQGEEAAGYRQMMKERPETPPGVE